MPRGIGAQVNQIPTVGRPAGSTFTVATTSQPAWVNSGGSRTYTNSDFTVATSASGDNNFVGITSVASGLVLVEFKATTTWTSSGDDAWIGFSTSSTPLATSPGAGTTAGIGWRMSGEALATDLGGAMTTSFLPTVTAISAGDIMQMILDMDNGRLYCGYNGDWGTQNPRQGIAAINGFSVASPLYRHARTFYSGDEITITNPIEQALPSFAAAPNSVDTWGN